MCDKDSCNIERLLRSLPKHCEVKERRYVSGFVRPAKSSANVWCLLCRLQPLLRRILLGMCKPARAIVEPTGLATMERCVGSGLL